MVAVQGDVVNISSLSVEANAETQPGIWYRDFEMNDATLFGLWQRTFGKALSKGGPISVGLRTREAPVVVGQRLVVKAYGPQPELLTGTTYFSAAVISDPAARYRQLDPDDDPLLSAIHALRTGHLKPPATLASLLTQAVEAREARIGEDVDAWSDQLADEVARADS